jgi:hypothetical protein
MYEEAKHTGCRFAEADLQAAAAATAALVQVSAHAVPIPDINNHQHACTK